MKRILVAMFGAALVAALGSGTAWRVSAQSSAQSSPKPAPTKTTQSAPAKPAPAAGSTAKPVPAHAASTSQASAATAAAEQTATVKQFCVPCHNDRAKAGQLTLAAFDATTIAKDP